MPTDPKARLNQISQGLADMPSLARTGAENFDDQAQTLDMNAGGSPMGDSARVLHDPNWDKYFDMLHDSAGPNAKLGGGLSLMSMDHGLQLPSALPPSVAALGGGPQADWYPSAYNPNNPNNVKRNKTGL